MIPPIFTVCSVSTAVTALLGSNPLRVYPHGSAPQGVATPYVTWHVVGGAPENTLSCAADMDLVAMQVDVWGATATSTMDAAKAVRAAIESSAYIVSWRGTSKDPETKHYRVSFDIDWHVSR